VELLTSEHGLWEDFIGGLEGGTCSHSLFNSRGLLEHYAKSGHLIDIEGSLDWLRGEGGFCDCEVVLNVYYG